MIIGLQQQQPWGTSSPVRSAPLPQHGGSLDSTHAAAVRPKVLLEGAFRAGRAAGKDHSELSEDR
jgi:hypothetical protein